MSLINSKFENDVLTIYLKGHIDSANANDVENEINEVKTNNPSKEIIVDCQDLQYISSAGLRIILRLKKEFANLRIINVSTEVYEIFDVTGFTEMMDISKAYRVIDVEGCEAIGQGANGKVYRIDPDTIVKVYLNPDSLPDIKRERELARTALILGIPTAIPYDVVRVGDGYGSVFELLNASSFAQLIIKNEKPLEEVVDMSVDLLKKIHSTLVDKDVMPDMKEVALGWVTFLKEYLPEETYTKLHKLVEDVPQDMHMLHGDYHIKNVMLQNGEVLLIDMDTLCTGHPVFEFASIYNAYVGYCELDHDAMKDFLGIPYETGNKIWDLTIHKYFEGKSEEEIQTIADKAKIIGYTRIMRRTIRRNGFDTEEGRAVIENAKKNIIELVAKTDSLVF